MPAIEREIEAFKAQEPELKKHHMGKFVVLYEGQLIGAYDTLDTAAQEALRRFPGKQFLIRQVGRPEEMPLPASVAFRPLHAAY